MNRYTQQRPKQSVWTRMSQRILYVEVLVLDEVERSGKNNLSNSDYTPFIQKYLAI